MKDDYTTILKEIQQTIASFSEGKISFNQALHKYTVFKEKAQQAQQQPRHENHILNVLATHNAKNFSIFSAIAVYTKKENKTTIALYHGPQTFVQPLLAICTSTYFSSPPRFVMDYVINQNVLQNFSYHSSLLFYTENLAIMFIAVSSSSFFSKDAFLKFAAHLKVFTSPYSVEEIISLDVPTITLKYIHQVCSKLLTRGPCSLYGIYLISPFSTLSHFGLHSLNEVSSLIKNVLIETFGQYSFALSMNLYLCITPDTTQNVKSLNFNYKDISIPSKIFHKVIEHETDIIPTIIQILHFH
ncbi:MAG: hypothetical protein N3F66_12415 [Spirochaetes bacterium]|nr:hypothetical protein [Spirochaetota bacterium]